MRIHMRRPKCLARAKSTGKPCQARSVYLDERGGGRCKFHGGLSTGPKTAEGLERLSAAVKSRWAATPSWRRHGSRISGARWPTDRLIASAYPRPARSSRQRARCAGLTDDQASLEWPVCRVRRSPVRNRSRGEQGGNEPRNRSQRVRQCV
jgi:hypothetical protein